jgi:hypothetical protein
MDIDLALWILIGVAIAFVACGCFMTAPAGYFGQGSQ